MAAVPEVGRAAGIEPGFADAAVAPEAAATQALYERYAGQVLGFCLHRLGSREEAEDAVQQTFMNAFRAFRRGVVPEAEAAWLFKIAENVCLTRRRSSTRRGRVESPGDLQALQDYVAAPQRLAGDELIQLQDALAAMPASQRKAILLREWQGLSYREIAEAMGLTDAAVETLIFRARRSLARGLEAAPERRPLLRRLRHALDLGALAAAAKGVLAGGAAVKAVATGAAAVAVAGVVAGSAPEPRGEEVPRTPLPAAADGLEPTSGAVRPAEGDSTVREPNSAWSAASDATPATPATPAVPATPATRAVPAASDGPAVPATRATPATPAIPAVPAAADAPPAADVERAAPAPGRAAAAWKAEARPKPKPKAKAKAKAAPAAKAKPAGANAHAAAAKGAPPPPEQRGGPAEDLAEREKPAPPAPVAPAAPADVEPEAKAKEAVATDASEVPADAPAADARGNRKSG